MIIIGILTLIGLVLFSALVTRVFRAMLQDETWLPSELATAKLLYSEQLFTGSAHTPIVARVDRAYWEKHQLHLVELKRRLRAEVYESDVIELSAQRVAVHAATGIDVSNLGTVVAEHPLTGRRIALRVELLPEERVINLIRRRAAILSGFEQPKDTCVKMRCAGCEYRIECKGETGAKVFPFIRSSPH